MKYTYIYLFWSHNLAFIKIYIKGTEEITAISKQQPLLVCK